jgi:WD40 repeat protein
MNQQLPFPHTDATTAGHRAKVFVSYSRKDLTFAQTLVEVLAVRGFDSFLDKNDIDPGEPWKERLAGLIASADTVLFSVSPDSVASTICGWELEESKKLGKRIIPVVARRIADADAPPALGRLNWVFLTEGDDWDAGLAALDTALRTDLPWVREHTRLGELARRWDELGRGRGATLRGSDLQAAEQWLNRRPADANAPTELHQDFIRASRQAANRRQRLTVIGSMLVALVSLGLAFTAFQQRSAALRSQSVYIAKLSRDSTDAGDAAAGLVLALTALPRYSNGIDRPIAPEALASLTHALMADRELVVANGHSKDVNTVEFAPNGSTLLTSSDDGMAILWDAQTGTIKHKLEGHAGRVLSALFSPNGHYVVTAGDDGIIRAWRTSDGRLYQVYKGHTARIRSVAFSPNGARIVTGSDDGTARIWQFEASQDPVVLVGHAGRVNAVIFSPDGTRVLTASDDASAMIWDANSGRRLYQLQGHSDYVLGLAYSISGTVVATYSQDNAIRLWNADTGALIRSLEGHEAPISALAFCPEDACLVSGSRDGTIRKWPLAIGTEAVVLGRHSGTVTRIAFGPREVMASTSRDRLIMLWNWRNGESIETLAGHGGEIFDVVFDASGDRIATGSRDKTARIWRVSGVAASVVAIRPKKSGNVLAGSHDGSLVITGDDDGRLTVFRAVDLQQIEAVDARTGPISSIAWSNDGTTLIVGTESGEASVWLTNPLRLSKLLTKSQSAITTVALSSDGGTGIVANADQALHLFDLSTGITTAVFDGRAGIVLCARFFGPGDQVLTGSIDGVVRAWNSRSGALIHSLKGRAGAILDVLGSDDGKIIYASSEDGSIQAWDAVTGRALPTVYSHSAAIVAIAVTPQPGGSRIMRSRSTVTVFRNRSR